MFCTAGYAMVARFMNFVTLPEHADPDMNLIGETLMGTAQGQYLLPFEAISVLLLACIIGGVVIARKH